MKNTRIHLSFFVLVLLIAAALTCTACTPVPTYNPTEANITSRTELGTGAKTVTFLAVDKDNNAAMFVIRTDAEYLSGALEEHGLISGYEGPYGLTVETVNGATLDFNGGTAYWAVYDGDTYANYGVDGLAIVDGGCYSLVHTVWVG